MDIFKTEEEKNNYLIEVNQKLVKDNTELRERNRILEIETDRSEARAQEYQKIFPGYVCQTLFGRMVEKMQRVRKLYKKGDYKQVTLENIIPFKKMWKVTPDYMKETLLNVEDKTEAMAWAWEMAQRRIEMNFRTDPSRYFGLNIKDSDYSRLDFDMDTGVHSKMVYKCGHVVPVQDILKEKKDEV